MKELKLQKLTLKNFKGVTESRIEPEGKDFWISGDNGTGKTSHMDAMLWLFTGKDSQGKADFGVKPVTEYGEEIHNIDIEVEAEIEANGTAVNLTRTFREKWVTPRGKAVAEFNGHETEFKVNGSPKKKKDFEKKVDELIDRKRFDLLTDPGAFNRLPWKERREIVLNIIGGDVDAEEVLTVMEEHEAELMRNVLAGDGIDDERASLKASQTKINKKLREIPARIDELKSASADIKPPREQDVKNIEKQISEQRDKLNDLKTGGAEAEKKKEVAEIETKILEERNKATGATAEKIANLRADRAELVGKKQETQQSINFRERACQECREYMKKHTDLMEALRKDWHETDANAFDESATVCPTCGQDLPKDQVKAAREKFNADKAEALENINKKGMKAKAAQDEAEKDYNQNKTAREQLEKERDNLRGQIKDVDERIAELENMAAVNGGDLNADIEKLEKQKSALEMEIKAIKNGRAQQEKNINEKIDELQSKLAELQKQKAEYDSAGKSRQRIEQLEKEEKDLAVEFEESSQKLSTLEKYEMERARILENRAADHFKLARFKLFNQQINTGVEQTCETTLNGVGYHHGLSNSERINVDLDIINTLQYHYGFRGPVWVDNAEAVSELIDIDAQKIEMYVTAGQEFVANTTE